LFTFAVKVIAGGVLCFGVVQLAEAGMSQASVAFEELPLLASDRPGGDCGEFVLPVRLVKCSMRDIVTAKTIQTMKKPSFIGDANDDEVWVRTIGKKKRFADFENGVASLDDLLRKRQVGPDKDVDVLSGDALCEFHGKLR
jgi:hypothetical protein